MKEPPHPEDGVPEAEVGEGDERAVDDLVVVLEQALLQAFDVLEALRRVVAVLEGLQQPGGEGVDHFEGVGQAAGEQRVQEAGRVRHQAPAVADGLLRGVLEPVRRHPLADLARTDELPLDRRVLVEEELELLLGVMSLGLG